MTGPRVRRSPEPLAWLLFSGGGMVAALLIPVLLLLFGVVFPLGWLDAPGYPDMHSLLRNPVTIVVLLGLCVLSLFHAAHRFRFVLVHGFRLGRAGKLIAVLCYGSAIVGSVVAAVVLIGAA